MRVAQAILFVTLGILLLPSLAQEAPEPYRSLLSVCKGLDNSLKCARAIENAQAKGAGRRHFSRKSGLLTVHTLAGPVSLSDINREDGDDVLYSYLAYLPELRLHVLHTQYWEGNVFLVVNHASGATAYVDGFPNPSPDKRRFVVISSSGVSGYYPNSVEVWGLNAGTLTALYRYEPSPATWSPRSAAWIDSNTIKLYGDCEEDSRTKKECPNPELRFRNASWRMTWSVKKREEVIHPTQP